MKPQPKEIEVRSWEAWAVMKHNDIMSIELTWRKAFERCDGWMSLMRKIKKVKVTEL